MKITSKKRFGQHWLQSEIALLQIVEAAALQNNDRLLEIGPGTGILTERLLPIVEAVVGVEIDRDLCQQLRKKFKSEPKFQLIETDILALDLSSLPLHNKVVANIPYNITGPILGKVLGSIAKPVKDYEVIVLLVQKEVAQRLSANPATTDYGALSVKMQYLAEIEMIATVPAKAFYPPPQVDSAIIRLTPRTYPQISHNPKHLETIIKLGFASKRKMLKNNLKGLIESDSLSQILEQLDINPQSRAEELGISHWIELSNNLTACNPTPS